MRATPPCARISAGTRSSAITAQAPASSAIRAWSAVVTSMITPPFSISARPVLTLSVPISIGAQSIEAESGGCPADDRVGRRRDHEHARGRVPQHGLDRVAERLATAPPRTDDDEVDTARLGLLREDLPGLAAAHDAIVDGDPVRLADGLGAVQELLRRRVLVVHVRVEREERRYLVHRDRR